MRSIVKEDNRYRAGRYDGQGAADGASPPTDIVSNLIVLITEQQIGNWIIFNVLIVNPRGTVNILARRVGKSSEFIPL